jgi:hypothetical protein
VNDENLKPFKKGYDPRRNIRGVPSTAIEVRRLIQAIGAQKLPLPQSEQEKAAKKRKRYITRLEALLTAMFSSRAPADKQTILKGGYPGLLKDEIDLGDSVIRLLVEYTDREKTNNSNA